MCANAELLNGWLRGGGDGAVQSPPWNGTVIGDCGAVQFIETDHRWVGNQSAAAAAALNAGVDLDCSISLGRGFAALINATKEGLTEIAFIDRALGRFLENQMLLGYYDPVGWGELYLAPVCLPPFFPSSYNYSR
jgi:hypothetical protein